MKKYLIIVKQGYQFIVSAHNMVEAIEQYKYPGDIQQITELEN